MKKAVNAEEDILAAIFDSTYRGGDVFGLVARVVNRKLEIKQMVPGLEILAKHHLHEDLLRMIPQVTRCKHNTRAHPHLCVQTFVNPLLLIFSFFFAPMPFSTHCCCLLHLFFLSSYKAIGALGFAAGSPNVVEWARDRASTNEAAVVPLLIIFPGSLNGPCFSHTGNNTLEKLNTPHLDAMADLLAGLMRAPIAEHEWRCQGHGAFVKQGGTRWGSTQENRRYIRNHFDALRAFVNTTTSESAFKERASLYLAVNQNVVNAWLVGALVVLLIIFLIQPCVLQVGGQRGGRYWHAVAALHLQRGGGPRRVSAHGPAHRGNGALH